MELSKKAFKAYDIRGIVPGEVNAELAYRVGRVFAAMFATETAVVGHDIRQTGPELANAVADGLRDGGCNVYDIGECGTEMVYYAISPRSISAWMAASKLPPAITRWITTA